VTADDQRHPQGVRVRLHAFRDVPAQPVTLREIVNRPERDVRIVGNPGRANKDDQEQEYQQERQNVRLGSQFRNPRSSRLSQIHANLFNAHQPGEGGFFTSRFVEAFSF
jgi:hypothetical protein